MFCVTTGFARRRSHAAVTQRQSRRIHVCRQSNVLICTTDSTVSQPPVTLLIHVHCHQNLHFNLDYVAQTHVRLGRCFVNAASHECRPSWMTSQWSALTNQRPLFHTRYFCSTHEKFHRPFHTCMNSYVEDFKSFTEHFIRVWIHTSKISYAYQIKRVWKIRVCKIPWMILHNDTRIKSYTYEKLHVWKITRMKSYKYWILCSDWCIVIRV